ncbi:Hypothetical_protein [Hexamita inflata]|uniref:Hypothetical_protein n=1 Tax=Hexamita inflata TaxID=28002 RepID=A0AA86PDN2_9EUKA|nr:Hypothetical protein HINF_LOCUS24282 [Hexamita inflata]
MRGSRSTVCRRPCASPRYERRVQTHGRAANHSALGRLIPKQREGPGYSLWRTPDKRSLLRAAFECNTSTCAAETARRSSALLAAAVGVVRLELGSICQATHTAAKCSAVLRLRARKWVTPRLWSGQLPAKSETNSCSQLQSGPNALIRSCNRTHRM